MSKNIMYEWVLVKILVIVSFVGMIAANTAAVVLPLNGISTKGVSDLYPNLFTPAPYTFSIWGVIYLALAGFIIYQISPPHRGKGILTPSDLLRIRFAFIFSCIINILWIFSWHYLKLTLSVILMLVLLISLIYINRLTRAKNLNTREKLLVRAPFSLYFGWITVATIANIAAFLVGNSWNGFGLSPVTWTILMMFAGILIASIVVIQNKDYIYPLVILWAYGGILNNHFSASGFGGHYYSIMIATVACMVIMLVVTVTRSLYRE